MRTIMIVDDNYDFFNRMKNVVLKEEMDLIHTTNSRHGLETLSDNHNVELILIHTHSPQTNSSSYISLKPNTNLRTFSDGTSEYLEEHCSEDQFISFIKDKI